MEQFTVVLRAACQANLRLDRAKASNEAGGFKYCLDVSLVRLYHSNWSNHISVQKSVVRVVEPLGTDAEVCLNGNLFCLTSVVEQHGDLPELKY